MGDVQNSVFQSPWIVSTEFPGALRVLLVRRCLNSLMRAPFCFVVSLEGKGFYHVRDTSSGQIKLCDSLHALFQGGDEFDVLENLLHGTESVFWDWSVSSEFEAQERVLKAVPGGAQPGRSW